MKLSFIGTGNMGGAIVRAICSASDPDAVYISNRNFAKSEALAEACGCHACRSNTECARDANYIFLGVKPEQVRDVLREIEPVLNKRQVIVSMAAGVTGDIMRDVVGKKQPIIRILPNTPCAIGKGLVLIAPCGGTTPEMLAELQALLAPCGLSDFTDEAHADAATVVGGCVPAFTYMYIEALADSAVLNGLPRADALAWAAQAEAGDHDPADRWRGQAGSDGERDRKKLPGRRTGGLPAAAGD